MAEKEQEKRTTKEVFSWVSLSDKIDTDGKPFILIGGVNYPQKIARLVADEIMALLKDRS